MQLAALDLGSSSFHLLVVETDGASDLIKVHSQKEVLRLGAVVQEHGQLGEAAFAAALASVERLAQAAREHGADQLFTVATSALRDARNGSAFCAACREQLGVAVEVLSGEQEASLAYLGARSGVASTTARVLVVDVGGGSVELAVGESNDCQVVQSLPLGFLRLARFFPGVAPGASQQLTRYVQLECENARWQLGRFDTLLLSGGTARALSKLLGAGVTNMSSAELLRVCAEVASSSPEQLQAQGVEASRASTLACGAAVIAGIVAAFGQPELGVSSRGVREGVLLRELSRRAATRAA